MLHNLADMWTLRKTIKSPEVARAYMARFAAEYKNFMAGIYVH